jgi:hypothetical protein
VESAFRCFCNAALGDENPDQRRRRTDIDELAKPLSAANRDSVPFKQMASSGQKSFLIRWIRALPPIRPAG